jgi:hypothetical protein
MASHWLSKTEMTARGCSTRLRPGRGVPPASRHLTTIGPNITLYECRCQKQHESFASYLNSNLEFASKVERIPNSIVYIRTCHDARSELQCWLKSTFSEIWDRNFLWSDNGPRVSLFRVAETKLSPQSFCAIMSAIVQTPSAKSTFPAPIRLPYPTCSVDYCEAHSQHAMQLVSNRPKPWVR